MRNTKIHQKWVNSSDYDLKLIQNWLIMSIYSLKVGLFFEILSLTALAAWNPGHIYFSW